MGTIRLLFLLLLANSVLAQQSTQKAELKVIEIRCYTLKKEMRSLFHEIAKNESLPLLSKYGIEVVSMGPSIHDENSYYLIRAFDDISDREKKEKLFYESDDWINGARDKILSMIENYSTVVLLCNSKTIKQLRKLPYVAD